MFTYRPDEGVYARGTAFWALAAFAYLAGRRFFLFSTRWDFANGQVLYDGNIPVLGFPITWAFVMGLVVFLGCMWGIWKLVNSSKIGGLLIDTEVEMKKVTWPSLEDSRKSAMVVILCVVVMVAFLSASDVGLQWLFLNVVYGGAGHGR